MLCCWLELPECCFELGSRRDSMMYERVSCPFTNSINCQEIGFGHTSRAKSTRIHPIQQLYGPLSRFSRPPYRDVSTLDEATIAISLEDVGAVRHTVREPLAWTYR